MGSNHINLVKIFPSKYFPIALIGDIGADRDSI